MSEDVLERQRARVSAAITGEVELPSGGKAGLELPNQKKLLLSGELPLPVLELMQKAAKGEVEELGLEGLNDLNAHNERLIRMTVKSLDGEAVDLTDVDLDELFTIDDQADITAYIQRTKPLPGKA